MADADWALRRTGGSVCTHTTRVIHSTSTVTTATILQRFAVRPAPRILFHPSTWSKTTWALFMHHSIAALRSISPYNIFAPLLRPETCASSTGRAHLLKWAWKWVLMSEMKSCTTS